MDYLAAHPGAPVHSLGEIIDRGDYDKALENTFKLRNKRRVARDRGVSPRTSETGGGAGADRGGDGRAETGRARLPSADEETGAGRRTTARFVVPAERRDGAAGDQHAGRLHVRRSSDRDRAARARMDRTAARFRSRTLRAAHPPASTASLHAGARRTGKLRRPRRSRSRPAR